jgi:RNA polymerase sigma-70 factor, ECF subfamily
MSYLVGYLGNKHDAEDVFQETWIKIHTKFRTFECGRRFRPWMYRIATNTALDHLRKKNRHKIVSLDKIKVIHSKGDNEDYVESAYDHTLEASYEEIDSIETDEIRDNLMESLNTLPVNLRQIVELVYLQKLKYLEAANILRIPEGTLKSRLHTALKHLRASPLIQKLDEAA